MHTRGKEGPRPEQGACTITLGPHCLQKKPPPTGQHLPMHVLQPVLHGLGRPHILWVQVSAWLKP